MVKLNVNVHVDARNPDGVTRMGRFDSEEERKNSDSVFRAELIFVALAVLVRIVAAFSAPIVRIWIGMAVVAVVFVGAIFIVVRVFVMDKSI